MSANFASSSPGTSRWQATCEGRRAHDDDATPPTAGDVVVADAAERSVVEQVSALHFETTALAGVRRMLRDARASRLREGEQREDETHERRVDAEAGGESATHPGEDAVVGRFARSEVPRPAQPPARTTSIRPAPTRASTTSKPSPAVLTEALRPSSCWRRT